MRVLCLFSELWYFSFMTLPASMTSPDVRKLFKLLGKTHVRFVGGCVRNMLMGVPVGDVDLATTHSPDDVMRILGAGGVKIVPTGIDHGTVTAVLKGVGYEITTLRRDVDTDGRRAVVAYTKDWAEDAARRDFTINALYADLDGKIYDPLGMGLADIKRFKVVFVGDAEMRIQEDYLRILRFFRFQCLYGKGAPDKKALVACAKFAPKILTLSRERVTQELTKIIMANNPQKILSVMQKHKILPDILGKSFYPDRIGSMVKIQKKALGADLDVLYCARLLSVLGFQFKESGKIFNHLILNKKQISILSDACQIKIDTQRFDTFNFAKNLYHFSWGAVAVAVMVAAVKGNLTPTQFQKIWAKFLKTERPVFPVSGKDLLAKGFVQGEAMGAELKRLEQLWIKSRFALTKLDLLG